MEASFKESLTEFARMRTFLYFYIASFVIFLGVIFEEYGPDFHEFDDVVFVILALIAILLIASRWKNRAVSALKSTNNTLAIIAAVMILISIYAVLVELGDPADLGDDIPQLILSIIILASRFFF